MSISRRALFHGIAATCVLLLPVGARGQSSMPFDPIAVAKLRAGEIARFITSSPRDKAIPEPSHQDVFDTGLLLQAGLRALLPVGERQGVALPGSPSSSDPPELAEAQKNYQQVFESGAMANADRKAIAVKSIGLAADRLGHYGYADLAKAISAMRQ